VICAIALQKKALSFYLGPSWYAYTFNTITILRTLPHRSSASALVLIAFWRLSITLQKIEMATTTSVNPFRPTGAGFTNPNFPPPNGAHDAHIIIYGSAHLPDRGLRSTDTPANGRTRYTPSIVLASLAIALFTICSVLHMVQMLRFKTWSFGPLTFACILEVLGYVFRTLSSQQDPYSIIWFVLQYFLIVVAPVFISASIYVCITQLIRRASACGYDTTLRPWLIPKWILWGFITVDAVTTVLQIAGAAMIGSFESKGKDPAKGNHILLAGLAIQSFALTIFVVLVVVFRTSIGRDEATKALVKQRNAFIVALFAASFLIYFRTVFRLAETAQGVFGNASTHEVFFGTFEFAPVVAAVGTLAFWHPGRWFSPTESMSKEKESQPLDSSLGKAQAG